MGVSFSTGVGPGETSRACSGRHSAPARLAAVPLSLIGAMLAAARCAKVRASPRLRSGVQQAIPRRSTRLALACERAHSRGTKMLAVASHLMERDGRPLLASAQRGMTQTRGRGASARSGLEGLPLRKKSHEDFMYVFWYSRQSLGHTLVQQTSS